jgi:hypothetical protein
MDLNPYANAADPLNITQGNPYLKPELTRKLELSHTYTGSKNTLLTSSLYYSSNKSAVEQIAEWMKKGSLTLCLIISVKAQEWDQYKHCF